MAVVVTGTVFTTWVAGADTLTPDERRTGAATAVVVVVYPPGFEYPNLTLEPVP